jgi:peptide/nickel transport system substrate-binding protein
MNKKHFLRSFIALSVVFTTALTGCSSIQETKEITTAAPKEGGKLVIARQSDASSFDPHFTNSVSTSSFSRYIIYEGLVQQDKNMEIQPMLATEWKQVDDVTWEFKLRQGVSFQDGTRFTAEAVKKSFERISDKNVASPRAVVFKPVKEIKIVDDYTVQLVLHYPFAPILSILASQEASIISPAAIEQYGKDLTKHPVGTGPFTFKSWTPGQETVLVKNETYWGEKPKVDEVVFKVVPEGATRISMVETGEAHIAEPLPVTEIERVEASTGMSLYRSEGLATEFIGFNMKKKPFDDVRVRQAISHAIEADAIITGVYNNVGTKAISTIGPKVFGYTPNLPSYDYDLPKAKALLSEAGYPNGFKTTIWTYDRKERVNLAEVAQSQLKGIGIDAEVKVLEYATFISATGKGEHDIFIGGWGNATGDADYNQSNMFKTSPTGDTNSFFYSNPEVDKLIEEGRKETDPVKRKEIYAKAQEIEIKDAVFIPIRNGEQIAAINNNVKGFWMNPSGYLILNEVSILE